MNEPLLKLDGIGRAFFGIPVLQDVSLTLRAGQTLGLVGENGAGKSTLMNILGGNLQPDAGDMVFEGAPYAPRSPRDAEEAGIAFIHQELNLFLNLSIAENLFLTRFPHRFGRIDRRAMRRRAAELLDHVGLDLPPHLRIESLSAGERQLVEIAKSLHLNAKLMILDEPTTSLTAREMERLFELLASLQARGMALIYISHALDDVRRLGHQIVVLRDGRIAATGMADGFDTNRLVSLMVGRDVEQQFPPRTNQPAGEVALRACVVSQPGVVENVSFALHRGEVLGISGLMGSGRTELARILFGLDPMSSGEVELDGEPITHLSTRQRIKRGMAMLTEGRRDDGLAMPASIWENLSLVSAPRYATRPLGMLRRARLRRDIEQVRHSVKLTPTADLQQPVRTLSGGNQQKVVLAKWLLNRPRVLILDEPTRGIDVGAKYEIYKLVGDLATGGAAVLIISSEIEELLGICDRILVISRGDITDEVSRESFDRNRIMRAALQTHLQTGGLA